MGFGTPGRAPGYLQLWLLPLRIRLSILQLLQVPLVLVPGLAPLFQLVQQHVTHLHLLMDFGLDLLYDHLDGYETIFQAGCCRRRVCCPENSPQGRAGDTEMLLQDVVTGLTGWGLEELCSGGWLG